MPTKSHNGQEGIALIVVLVLVAVLMVLVAGFAGVTSIETATTRSSMRAFQGFYAAEAGLNARADQFRQLFVGESLPTGVGPTISGTPAPCFSTNQGSGDFRCTTLEFQGREVKTYVVESALSTNSIVIPRGETFQNQFGQEYHYIVYSQALNANGASEASLEMHFKSRTIPLFQWAAFYDKDLEIFPTPGMVFGGPVHSNANVYVGTSGTIDVTGQFTSAKSLIMGRKDANTCLAGPVRANNPDTLAALPACSGGRRTLSATDVAPWGGMVGVGVDPVSVPGAEVLERANGRPYWTRADARIVLNVNGGTPQIEVRNADGSVDASKTAHLATCGGAVGTTNTLYDNREASAIRMLDLDVQQFLTCVKLPNLVTASLPSGGDAALTLFLSVDGPNSAGISRYGVRLKNGAELTSVLPATSTNLTGMTVVSDQPVYIQGNYNTTLKKPAAVMGDVINVLSNNWSDASSTLALASRVPTATAINAAFFSGTDTTGGAEGSAGQDAGGYNGGLENFVRLHENFNSAVTLTYRGSMVSLFRPRHVSGAWALGGYYTAPIRDWNYDADLFEVPELLPPMTPQLVYLRQELFVRKFDS